MTHALLSEQAWMRIVHDLAPALVGEFQTSVAAPLARMSDVDPHVRSAALIAVRTMLSGQSVTLAQMDLSILNGLTPETGR